MPEKHTLRKLANKEVESLKGKLVEVRRIGAQPIFIAVAKTDTIKMALNKADIPQDDEIKVEAVKTGGNVWRAVKMTDKAYQFARIAVTTRVSGA